MTSWFIIQSLINQFTTWASLLLIFSFKLWQETKGTLYTIVFPCIFRTVCWLFENVHLRNVPVYKPWLVTSWIKIVKPLKIIENVWNIIWYYFASKNLKIWNWHFPIWYSNLNEILLWVLTLLSNNPFLIASM